MEKVAKYVFPLIIVIFSIYTGSRAIEQPLSNISALVSLTIAAISLFLFFMNNLKYDAFFYAWIIIQLPHFVLQTKAGQIIHIVDAFPSYFLPIELHIGRMGKDDAGGVFMAHFNLFPVLFFIILNYFNGWKPVGYKFTIHRFKKGSFPQVDFPISGLIESVVGRMKAKPVYRVALDKEIIIKDKAYKHILLQPKDSFIIQTVKKNQVCGFRLCESADGPYGDKENPFIAWVLVEKEQEAYTPTSSTTPTLSI